MTGRSRNYYLYDIMVEVCNTYYIAAAMGKAGGMGTAKQIPFIRPLSLVVVLMVAAYVPLCCIGCGPLSHFQQRHNSSAGRNVRDSWPKSRGADWLTIRTWWCLRVPFQCTCFASAPIDCECYSDRPFLQFGCEFTMEN